MSVQTPRLEGNVAWISANLRSKMSGVRCRTDSDKRNE